MKFWAKNLIALLLGVGSCTGTFYIGKTSMHKLKSWESVVGNISSSRDIRRTASFTYDGKPYTIYVGNDMDNKDNSRIATVIFPKEDPSQGEVRNYKMLLGIPLLLGVFGFIMIAVAYFSLRHKSSGRPAIDPNSPEILQQKEEMKQNVLEMKRKFDDLRNKIN